MAYFAEVAQIVASRDDFTLLIGPEELLARSIQLGGFGGVTGGANLFPSLYVALYEAASGGNIERAAELQNLVQRISDGIYHVSDCGACVLQGIKTALSELGICSGVVARPFRDYRDDERELIANALDEIEPLVERLCRAEAAN